MLRADTTGSPSLGAGSILKQCTPGERIFTVSAYHAYKREGLRRIEHPLRNRYTHFTGKNHR